MHFVKTDHKSQHGSRNRESEFSFRNQDKMKIGDGFQSHGLSDVLDDEIEEIIADLTSSGELFVDTEFDFFDEEARQADMGRFYCEDEGEASRIRDLGKKMTNFTQ